MSEILIKLGKVHEQLLFDFCMAIDAELKNEKNLPEKFPLAQKCFGKIMVQKPASRTEVAGLLDTIGGYMAAMIEHIENLDSIKAQNQAKKKLNELMTLARQIEKQVIQAQYKGPALVGKEKKK